MKDFKNSLFAGALGKTSNPSGSRFMTIPLTRDISNFAYEIDYEPTGDFVCCTLNGLLLLYDIESTFNIIALKRNDEKYKFEFAENKYKLKETIRARGIDWILLQNSFIFLSDNQIKINTLLDTTEEKFLYSVLRAYQGWGDKGYFSTNYEGLYPAGTHQMEHCYSVLPAVGEYQIIEDFLIRRNSGTPQLYPLIPLEFNYEAEPTYGTDYGAENRGIQLAMINSELWGRGVKNIGKISILPAVFDENGNPEEFYLYISPEYRKDNLPVGYWDNLSIAGTKRVIGFISESADPITSNTCIDAISQNILSLDDNQWQSLRPNENIKLVVDTSNGNWLALGEKGVTHNDDNYDCKNLSTWIAPTGKIESIEEVKVISSTDNMLINTNIDTGFNRELVRLNKSIPNIDIFIPRESKVIDVYKNWLEIQYIKTLDISSWEDNYSAINNGQVFEVKKSNFHIFYYFNPETKSFDKYERPLLEEYITLPEKSTTGATIKELQEQIIHGRWWYYDEGNTIPGYSGYATWGEWDYSGYTYRDYLIGWETERKKLQNTTTEFTKTGIRVSYSGVKITVYAIKQNVAYHPVTGDIKVLGIRREGRSTIEEYRSSTIVSYDDLDMNINFIEEDNTPRILYHSYQFKYKPYISYETSYENLYKELREYAYFFNIKDIKAKVGICINVEDILSEFQSVFAAYATVYTFKISPKSDIILLFYQNKYVKVLQCNYHDSFFDFKAEYERSK